MGFFDPDWMGTKEDKALRSLAEITGDEALYEVVRDARLESVRLAAIERIEDEGLLARIALNPRLRLYTDENPESVAAARMISSLEALSDVFLKARHFDVLEAVEEQIGARWPGELEALRQRREDAREDELFRLATTGVDPTQRLQALMDSQRDATAIAALDDESRRVRIAAIGKVRDLGALVAWLKRAGDAVPADAEVLHERLADLSPDLLGNLACDEGVPEPVRRRAKDLLAS